MAHRYIRNRVINPPYCGDAYPGKDPVVVSIGPQYGSVRRFRRSALLAWERRA